MAASGPAGPVKPPVLVTDSRSTGGLVNGDPAPEGTSSTVFASYRSVSDAGVVVLVPVRRGRAAVALGHGTSSLALDSSCRRSRNPTVHVPRQGHLVLGCGFRWSLLSSQAEYRLRGPFRHASISPGQETKIS